MAIPAPDYIQFAEQHGFEVAFCRWYFDRYSVGEFATIQMMHSAWKAATDQANAGFLKAMGVK